MCSSKPSAPSAPPPPAPPPPPPAPPPQMAPAAPTLAAGSNQGGDAERSAADSIEAKKKGRKALKIDLQAGTTSGTGLNLPKG